MNSSHYTDSTQYAAALNGVLAKNWYFPNEKIKVWHKEDRYAQPTPELSEVKEIEVKDPNKVDADEVGLDIGFPLAGIYGGPYLTQYKNRNYAFVITIDGRTWGYEHNRCFIFYKEQEKLNDTFVKTNLMSVDCGDAKNIKSSSTFPKIPGFSDLNDEGKEILNKLSNVSWEKNLSLTNAVIANHTLEWKETFSFSFWENYSYFNYSSKFMSPASEHFIGPFENGITPKIQQIAMRYISDKVMEFVIWTHRPGFVSQEANMMAFAHGNNELWSAKSHEEVEKIKKSTVESYCYQGFDCTEKYSLDRLHDTGEQDINAHYIILRYDQDRDHELEVSYEMVDPRFPAVKSKFTAN